MSWWPRRRNSSGVIRRRLQYLTMTEVNAVKEVKGVKEVKLRLLVMLALVLLPAWTMADQAKPQTKPAPVDLATAKPGRDPNQTIDEEYTKKIKEYTTETFFLSPLVDYMPAAKGVPTPTAVLGDIAGAPGKLPYSKETHDYMKLLAKSSPRVKVYTI